MKKILFIEDAPDLISMYRAMFESAGYEMINTDDPLEGFEMAAREKPALILLDIILPPSKGEVANLNERYGQEILKRLKGHPETKNIPVLVFTNLNTPQDRKLAKSLGALEYIIKADVLPKEMVKIVASYLRKSR